jgi:8-oxo-dGTP pyrophosphatase MutT (NUDIX family)
MYSSNSPAITSAVLVPVIAQGSNFNVLLMQRSQNVKHHKNEICFPGGILSDTDADLTATALRETFEETGIPCHQIKVITTLPNCYTPTGYCITPIVGIIKTPINYKLCPREVQCVFEIPLQYLLDNVTEHNYITYQKHIIWGATAKIISTFKDYWLLSNNFPMLL